MPDTKPTGRDGLIILGWLMLVVGSIVALGWGYGLMIAGLSLITLALFAL